MESSDDLQIDHQHVKLSLQAHFHTPVTAYYYLLLKKKIIEGQPLDDIEEDLPN
jgi:hypothetical protein